jgi:DNA polymerase (family 10)
MTNEEIAEKLKWYADLSELHDGNPFKIKSYAAAAFRIDKLPIPLEGKSVMELEQLEGVGKSVASKVFQLTTSGTFDELDELLETTPAGVQQLFLIKGIGPKKIAYIWNELGIESPGELLYACNENRLAQAKGFGIKTQESVKKSIEFLFSNAGKFHYARLEEIANQLRDALQQIEELKHVAICGEMARKCEILTQVDFIVASEQKIDVLKDVLSKKFNAGVKAEHNVLSFSLNNQVPISIHVCEINDFVLQQFLLTASRQHLDKLKSLVPNLTELKIESDKDIYQKANIQYVPVEMREGLDEIDKARQNRIPVLIELSDLKGILHNHTTYSDGMNTLEEMAVACKKMGYEYLGICDHSKSAFYAKGLKEEHIITQHAEIEALNKKLSPFKIFKGIESDILGDGSLDYSNDVLASFDFVVASVHSNLKMTEEKAMTRLMKAIENPYTTILGHPTGRLLLMREGYPVDHKKLIDACAANGVVIEINAHPYRLDLDWRYINYALEKGVMLSINPDAHQIEGYHDMYYGVCVARKGGLNKEMCLNAYTLEEIQSYFSKIKSKKIVS